MHIRKKLFLIQPDTEFEKSVERELSGYFIQLSDLLNGGLRLDENINNEFLTISDSGNANTEITVAHTLKRVPNGFIVVNIDKAGITYDSGTDWTATNIYLKCNAANCKIKIMVF